MNKSKLARELGIARSSLYYTRKREAIDEEVKRQIEAVLIEHPSYGHKRIALHLKMGHNRIRRVMQKYGLKPYRRRAKQPRKLDDQGKAPTSYPNLLAPLLAQQRVMQPNQVWCTDFTYLRYQSKFIYLATVIDVFTREIVGVNILRYHTRFLVIGALEDALKTYPAPTIVHSDQGSEHDSADFVGLVQTIGAQLSMSAKGAPWQNGYKESFYSHFKAEAGDLSRFETLGELVEFIYQHVFYYNHRRIHSALKMLPVEWRTRQTV
jgi:transposase InsO family protein